MSQHSSQVPIARRRVVYPEPGLDAVAVVNHPTDPRAFDLVDDGFASHGVIRQSLAFLRSYPVK